MRYAVEEVTRTRLASDCRRGGLTPRYTRRPTIASRALNISRGEATPPTVGGSIAERRFESAQRHSAAPSTPLQFNQPYIILPHRKQARKISRRIDLDRLIDHRI